MSEKGVLKKPRTQIYYWVNDGSSTTTAEHFLSTCWVPGSMQPFAPAQSSLILT